MTYSSDHRRVAAHLRAALRDGQPCARGGEPLYRWQLTLPAHHPLSLEADHILLPLAFGDSPPDALSCAHHNRGHGARLRNALAAARRAQYGEYRPPRARRRARQPHLPTPTSRPW